MPVDGGIKWLILADSTLCLLLNVHILSEQIFSPTNSVDDYSKVKLFD